MKIPDEHLKIETYSPAPWNPNVPRTGVTATHIPTGLSCQTNIHHTASENKEEAIEGLAKLVYSAAYPL